MTEKNNLPRVGTKTAGLSLIIMGTLFLLNTLGVGLPLTRILSLWPAMLIGLGLELIYANIGGKDITYDKGAVFLVIIMTIFALVMGYTQMILTYYL